MSQEIRRWICSELSGRDRNMWTYLPVPDETSYGAAVNYSE
jgi:hypothetical protein